MLALPPRAQSLLTFPCARPRGQPQSMLFSLSHCSSEQTQSSVSQSFLCALFSTLIQAHVRTEKMPSRVGTLGLKIHLETKPREELSHSSKAQASFLPFFPSPAALWRGCPVRQTVLPRVSMGWMTNLQGSRGGGLRRVVGFLSEVFQPC